MAQTLILSAALPRSPGRPTTARELRAGILHIGVGNFHRAHQAVYLDDLFNAGRIRLGAHRRRRAADDAAMRDALERQDWLTTVVELEPGANRPRV